LLELRVILSSKHYHLIIQYHAKHNTSHCRNLAQNCPEATETKVKRTTHCSDW